MDRAWSHLLINPPKPMSLGRVVGRSWSHLLIPPPHKTTTSRYFEGGSGLGWPRRPLRYFPFFGAPVPGPAQPPFGGGWGDWAWA